jgi:cystathionine beta-synthase
MFNDDWMRDRNFLEVTKPKAIDLVANHKNQKLLTIDVTASVNEALSILNKYNISQIPVVDKGEYVGSLNDNYLFNKLIENNDIKNQTVKAVMQSAFPVVGEQAPIEEVSKLITKDNNAVLLRDLGGNMHIITKHDIIEAVAKMNN